MAASITSVSSACNGGALCNNWGQKKSFLGQPAPAFPACRRPAFRTTCAGPRSMAKKATKDAGEGKEGRRNLVLGAGALLLAGGAYLATPDPEGAKAVATLDPTSGSSVSGTVNFTETTSHFGQQYIRVDVNLTGLTPGKHGFHIHEKGNVSCSDGMCTGGHFNPEQTPHGAKTAPASQRHAGDFGNIIADKDGVAKVTFLDEVVQLQGPKSIVGRSVVVHAKDDDLKSQPSGDAGGRVAFGTIRAA